MTVLRGDILDIESGIVAHQVNCLGIAGAGLALKMRYRITGWYDDYKSHLCELGGCHLFDVTPYLHISNLFGQASIGTGLKTNYGALRQAMKSLSESSRDSDKAVFMPWGIGCGLGGGEWSIVLGIIEEELPHSILVKYE